MTHPDGLTTAEVKQRRAAGKGNTYQAPTSRTYYDILTGNTLNFINLMLFAVGGLMMAIGRWADAITSLCLVLLNIVIGIFQEIRAKHQLDKVALLLRPEITVIRDGRESVVDPSQLVVDDLIVVRAGDQIVVDGVLVGTDRIDVDESLLTGESDLVAKGEGDKLMSGSFCVSGSARMVAQHVGIESFANQLTASARAFRVRKTPLQRDVDFAIRLLTVLAALLGFLLLLSAWISTLPFMRTIQAAAVVVGIIPNGLFFMVIVAYAMGALRIVRKGALVQQSNSIESLSNVTVLCMDKTGTLTANNIRYSEMLPLSGSRDEILQLLGVFARSASTSNRTSEALLNGVEGSALKTCEEVPFSSARKWSALSFDSDDLRGCYVLGAVEMLEPSLTQPLSEAAQQQITEWADQGLRVLLFAGDPLSTQLYHDEIPTLPALTALALVCFTDELRPHLVETLQGFADADIQLKIISGDQPQTVTSLAKLAGFQGDLTAVSGLTLDALSDEELIQVVQNTTIFGRITPQQKERLVDALRSAGHYVAMMGDGVNDVLSLKKADLGIAMQSGSAATRAVADLILLDDSFAALPPAFQEGQRIVNGMIDVLQLFLSRALYVGLLIVATSMVGVGFPFVPMHITLLTLLTVGIPTFALALWSRPGSIRDIRLGASVIHFVIPSALTVFVFGVVIFLGTFIISATQTDPAQVTSADIEGFIAYAGIDYDIGVGRASEAEGFVIEHALLTAQTVLTTFSMMVGLWLLVLVEPPWHWFVGGDRFSGDVRPTLLAAALLAIYLLVLAIPALCRFFELIPLPASVVAGLGVLSVAWMMLLRITWRRHWMERFLNLSPLRPDIDLSPQAEPDYKGTHVFQVKVVT